MMKNKANGPLYTIAEISSNHNRDLDRCFQLIAQAKDCGCDAVKFQYFRIGKLFHHSILEKSALHRQRVAWELPQEFIPPIAEYCDKQGIHFGCTPFFLEELNFLIKYVDFIKIASYELLWTELLQCCAATDKPVIISTGMATMEEVEAAVGVLRQAGAVDPIVLHCNSAYPTPPGDTNLAAIETMRHQLGCPVGWSDHTGNPAVVQRAVNRWGASVLEVHFDIDGAGAEYAGGHCWLPRSLKQLLSDLATGFAADGDGIKQPSPSDLPDRDWRADPADGLRPLQRMRETWGK